MTKIFSKTGNCPRIWMAPKLFAYRQAENVTQNKCAPKRKKSNSVVRGAILMKSWHQIIWPQTVLTVPSDLHKTRLGPSYGPKRVEKMKIWKLLWGHFSRTFTQKNQKIFCVVSFWTNTYLWCEFHENRARGPYFSVTVSHILPLNSHSDRTWCVTDLFVLCWRYPFILASVKSQALLNSIIRILFSISFESEHVVLWSFVAWQMQPFLVAEDVSPYQLFLATKLTFARSRLPSDFGKWEELFRHLINAGAWRRPRYLQIYDRSR